MSFAEDQAPTRSRLMSKSSFSKYRAKTGHPGWLIYGIDLYIYYSIFILNLGLAIDWTWLVDLTFDDFFTLFFTCSLIFSFLDIPLSYIIIFLHLKTLTQNNSHLRPLRSGVLICLAELQPCFWALWPHMLGTSDCKSAHSKPARGAAPANLRNALDRRLHWVESESRVYVREREREQHSNMM